MKSRFASTTITWIIFVLVLTAIISAAFWANLQLTEQLPMESEFQAKWQITRGLIFEQINPYEKSNPIPFISPLPAVLLYFPFALFENYDIARAAWITALQVVAIIFAYQCLRVTNWQAKKWLTGMFFLFALLWFPAVSIYLRGSSVMFMAAFFATALTNIQNKQDEIVGIGLALAALEPRVTWIGILLVLLWAVSRQRWRIIFWAGTTVLLTSGIGLLFIPSWPTDFFWTVLRNIDFNFGQTILETTMTWWPGVGEQIGWGFIILVSLGLLAEWWLMWGKNEKRLTWTIALTLVVAIWLGIETNLDHLLLLLIPLATIFMAWDQRWEKSGSIIVAAFILSFFSGLWWASLFFAQQKFRSGFGPILMLGFPLVVLILLYWIRWWFLRPAYLNLSSGKLS